MNSGSLYLPRGSVRLVQFPSHKQLVWRYHDYNSGSISFTNEMSNAKEYCFNYILKVTPYTIYTDLWTPKDIPYIA